MLVFNSYQCIRINNSGEFDKIYQYLRSAKNGWSLHDYLLDGGYPSFPIYLELSPDGSIGYTHNNIATWTKERMQILSLEQTLIQ
jgi:hypothetical protein